MLIRRAWVGEPPRERVDDQVDVYRSYSSKSAMEHWGSDELVDAPDAPTTSSAVCSTRSSAPAPTRSTSASTSPECHRTAAREQIAGLGDEVLPATPRSALARERSAR